VIPGARARRAILALYAWYAAILLFLSNLLNQIDRSLVAIMLVPIQKELGASDTAMGFLMGFSFVLSYTALGIPLARWADRGVRVWIVALSVTLWSAMTALCAFDPSRTNNRGRSVLAFDRISTKSIISGTTSAPRSPRRPYPVRNKDSWPGEDAVRGCRAGIRSRQKHMAEGLWEDVRGPNIQELARTSVLRLVIEDASAKVRTGPPIDDEEDYALPIWAGVVPLGVVPSVAEPDPRLATGIAPPRYVSEYRRPRRMADSR
jgi:hypothetical protein